MDHLLQWQIRESCRLALPEGLKDLMSDISREVLRAQPQCLYQFIADYLSVLLVAREHLFIASRVCDDVCKNRCWRELEDELRRLSLSDEDVQECLKIVEKYFSSDEVNEGILLQNLIQKIGIGQKELPAIQEAVRRAFLRKRVNNPVESASTDSELDETTLAAKHTLQIYKKATENPDINYHCVASKIQAAYRAYRIRRTRDARCSPDSGKKMDANEKVRFQNKKDQLTADLVQSKRCASKCSSVSLAGSFVSLPMYRPYGIRQRSDIAEDDEIYQKEMENTNYDYLTTGTQEDDNRKSKKTISFHSLPKVVEVDCSEVLDEADDADYESEEVDEDVVNNQLGVLEGIIENVVYCGDMNEEQSSSNEMVTRDTLAESELTGDETELSETSLEENDDGNYVQQSEMQRLSKDWVTDDYVQAKSGDDAKETMAISTLYDEMKPLEEKDGVQNFNELLRAVSDEVEIKIKSHLSDEYENFLV